MESSHTLLFVDDEPGVLNALKRLFKKERYEILTATGGKEGLEMMEGRQVSLIISDQRMPGMLGAEFLKRSREISPQTIRMMLTGYSDIEATTQAINEGEVYRFINKPWDDDQLRMTVREALERYDLGARNRVLTAELQQKNTELETLNAQLEQKVEERTGQIRTAYEKNLALVKSLQAKDRIAQHLLTVHPLEETLELVLEVISELLELDKAIIYLKKEGQLRPTAALGVFEPELIVGQDRLGDIDITPSHQRAFKAAEARREPLNVKDSEEDSTASFAVVPIFREDNFLGLIEVDRHLSSRLIAEEELQTVASFALQAAVAISDAQLHQDFDQWKGHLEDVLKDVDSIDDLTAQLGV